MDIETDFDLILIGKTGNGKSATGNSILGRSCFKSSYNTTSITKIPQYDVTDFGGLKIQVVDCPGVLDTDIDQSGGVDIVKGALQNAILTNPQGYHAFLIVVKFAHRFTKQEQDSIKILKDILGKDVVKNHGIVVLTNGDTFEYHCRENGLTLDKYCEEERGPFKELLKECNNRIVVFNNITEGENVKSQQIRELIVKINELQNKDHRYTNEDFRKAEFIHRRVLRKLQEPVIDKNMLICQSLTLLKLKNLINCKTNKGKIDQLNLLKSSNKKLLKSIEERDGNKGALTMLIDNVKGTQKCIQRYKISLSEENMTIQGATMNSNLVADQTTTTTSLNLPVQIKQQVTTGTDESPMDQTTASTQHKSEACSEDNSILLKIEQLEIEFFKIKREADVNIFFKCLQYIGTLRKSLFDKIKTFILDTTNHAQVPSDQNDPTLFELKVFKKHS